MVSQKTIKALDFEKILTSVGELCIAEDAADLLNSLYPLSDYARVVQEHTQLHAIIRSVQKQGALAHVARIPACMHVLNAPKSKVYTLEELALVRVMLQSMDSCAQWVDAMVHAEDTAPIEFSSAAMPRVLLQTLSRFFDAQGAVRTDNIPELRELERKRVRIHKARNKVADEFLRAHQAMCSSSIPTLRDDRVVLAIKASHKSDVAGIVHASSTREKSTYIEIPPLYELNNEALRVSEEERAAYYKLCVSLSEHVVKVSHKLRACYEAFLKFDALYARYQYGRMTHGTLIQPVSANAKPKKSQEHEAKNLNLGNCHLYLKNATNPFVDACSPLTFEFLEGVRQLILTGPNAGGKTVALKTLWLCALMNQSAIPLPLRTDDASRCALPVFECIDVVIGDAQNLEQGTSTFSSHIAHVHACIKNADAGKSSLMLFDEFCADTDDREGGALACALLEHLAKTNSTVCITTHSASVKHYVLTTPHSHASLAALRVARDKTPHAYSIAYNVIGMSEAVHVARNVGMPQSVLEGYEKFLRMYGEDYNSMLNALKNSYVQAEYLRAQLADEYRECKKRMEALQTEETLLAQHRRESAKQALALGAPLIADMRKTLERLGEKLATLQSAAAHALPENELADMKHGLRTERSLVGEFQESLAEFEQYAQLQAPHDEANNVQDEGELQVGERVYIVANNVEGMVLSVSKNKQKYRVQAGVLTLSLARHELRRVVEKAADERAPANFSYVDTTPHSLETYLDVRECTAEEAIEKLEAYIDTALLKNRKVFSVIHGKGAGVLMRELHRVLKQHRFVERAEYAEAADGGLGKTYVYLK